MKASVSRDKEAGSFDWSLHTWRSLLIAHFQSVYITVNSITLSADKSAADCDMKARFNCEVPDHFSDLLNPREL